MLLGIWVPSSLVEAEVTGDEILKGHVNGEALFADPDDVVHTQVAQLVQHHRFIVRV